jgi:hypothetical protein
MEADGTPTFFQWISLNRWISILTLKAGKGWGGRVFSCYFSMVFTLVILLALFDCINFEWLWQNLETLLIKSLDHFTHCPSENEGGQSSNDHRLPLSRCQV